MKAKVTEKQVKNNMHKIISIGYCELHYLLNYTDPQYYTAGGYGWNSDIYIIDNVAISTGYRSIKNKNLKLTDQEAREKVKKYNEKAKKIQASDLTFETKKTKTLKLLSEFISLV